MMFLNVVMLLGLIALASPILIHLLNRRQAKLVDWGAMQFLLASLTTRKRHIMIEEVILMAIRCLLLALLALAMARPFLPSRSVIPWAVVLPAVLGAALAAGIATAMWAMVRLRWLLIWLAALLVAVAAIATAREYLAQSRMWKSAAGEKDVVLVLDGSASMTMKVKGKTNFQRAVEEAQALVERCKPGDAISLIVTGSAPRQIVANPSADREELADALSKVKPVGGSMQVLKALNAAAASLAEGHNPGKKIVLLTDGQKLGWDLDNDSSWGFLAAGLDAMPSKPEIVCRTLELPERFRNLAVTDVTLSRQVIGTDRPVRINVKVANTGTEEVLATAVRLSINAEALVPQRVGNIPPGAAETVHFQYHFEQPGPYVLKAQVLTKDVIEADNAFRQVVNVIDRLRVLIVDGASGDRRLCGAKLARIALAPRGNSGGGRRRKGRQLIVEPEVVAATEMRSVAALHRKYPGFWRCGLIVLSNVPRLPAPVAQEILRFVGRGGGLLITPGDFAQVRGEKKAGVTAETFYRNWKTETGQRVAPAVLAKRVSVPDNPARAALKTFSHPALALVSDPAQSDLPQWRIKSYWKLEADEKDPSVRVAGLMDTGDPLLVERKLSDAKGYILMSAMATNLHDSNLPLLKCFVPLLHEVAYFLATPVMLNANVEPGTEIALELEPREGASPPTDGPREAAVTTPSGRQETASLSYDDGALRIRFTKTEEPGAYRVKLPEALAGKYPAMKSNPQAADVVPFVVLDDPGESQLQRLEDKDLSKAREHVKLRQANSFDELAAAVGGGIPGEELWRWLAIGALLALVAEIALTRWIAMQRKSHEIEEVEFGDGAEDLQTFRRRAREMLARSEEQGAAVSR